MGLKRNGNLYQDLPLRFRGGQTRSFVYAETNKSQLRNIFAGGVPQKGGLNAGALPPSAWVLPQKSGLIASFTETLGEGSLTASISGAVNGSLSIAGSSTLAASGFTTANLASNVSGSGSLTGTAYITLNGSASASGSSSLTASIGALANGQASIGGSCSSSFTVEAKGLMSATITTQTELSPASLAEAVWAAGLEGDLNSREAIKVMLAALAGKVSGAGTSTVTIRDITDTIDRITATVDANGNRSSVTINPE